MLTSFSESIGSPFSKAGISRSSRAADSAAGPENRAAQLSHAPHSTIRPNEQVQRDGAFDVLLLGFTRVQRPPYSR